MDIAFTASIPRLQNVPYFCNFQIKSETKVWLHFSNITKLETISAIMLDWIGDVVLQASKMVDSDEL